MKAGAAYVWEGSDLLLQVRVQARSSRDAWDGVRDGRFRVRISAAPVDGQANQHLQRFLAALFGVAKSQVVLLSGETGREKRWRIHAPKRLPLDIKPAL